MLEEVGLVVLGEFPGVGGGGEGGEVFERGVDGGRVVLRCGTCVGGLVLGGFLLLL